jgi:hypothetical protein
MTTTDRWLLERAQKARQEDAQAKAGKQLLRTAGYAKAFDKEAASLWRDLETELRRQVAVFSDASGRANTISVKTDGDRLTVEAEDGRQLTLTVDRTHRALTEAFRNSAGAVRSGRPRIAFTTTPEGRLSFNFGPVQSAAGSILRRLID